MSNFSFDIVSEYDKAEMNNCFDQTQREMNNRYDFKGTPAAIDWLSADKTGFKITGSGNYQIEAILDIARKKLTTRGQSVKVLDLSRPVIENNLRASKEVPFKQGLDQDNSKKITGLIRDHFPRIKIQVQGQAIRVISNSKDDLQKVIATLKQQEFDAPLNFTNFR